MVVLLQVLSSAALQLAHEGLGHNGSPRTYALLKRYYYWKGLKPMVRKHVHTCRFCQEHNKQAVKYSKYNFEAEPAPMKFISVRSNLDTHLSDTPFAIRQPIWRPRLLERVYKPIRTLHWYGVLQSSITESIRDRV